MTEKIIEAAADKHNLTEFDMNKLSLRVEKWNSYPIRFVGYGDNWKAIGFDVATALGYKRPNDAIRVHVESKDKATINLYTAFHRRITPNSVAKHDGIKRGNPEVVVINEFGIYDLVFSSKMKQAKEFKRWVYKTIQRLRKQSGLKGYEAFKMLDKRVQQQAMARLNADGDIDYIKANTIANKAIANKYGLPKMIKKGQMTIPMIQDRPNIINNVVELMNIKKRYGLNFSVSEAIYNNLKSD